MGYQNMSRFSLVVKSLAFLLCAKNCVALNNVDRGKDRATTRRTTTTSSTRSLTLTTTMISIPRANVTKVELDSSDDGQHIITFCNHIGIHPLNCSCKIIPDLCHVHKELKILHEQVQKDDGSTYERLEQYSLMYASVTVLASVTGITGNAAVLVMSFNQRKGLSSCKLHIAELGLINLLFSGLQLLNTIPLYWTNSWIYGSIMCKVGRTLMESLTLLTICFILIIAIERFVLIVYPFDGKLLEGKVKHVVFIIMIITVLGTSLPFFLGANIEDVSGRCVAFQGDFQSMALPYTWCVFGVYGVIPMVAMCAAYGRVIASLSNIGSRNAACSNVSMVVTRMKRNKRIIRNAFAILVIFLVCQIPHRLFYIYFAQNSSSTISEYLAIKFISYFLYPLQSTLNPLLYSMVDTTWRKNLKRCWLHAQGSVCGWGNELQSSTSRNNSTHGDNDKMIVHTLENNFDVELALIQNDHENQ